MRYDTDTALKLTLRRAAALRYRPRGRILSAGTGVCGCAMAALICALVSRRGVTLGASDFGAFLLPSQAGSYVLAGVLAFAAGVLVTLLCIHYRGGGGGETAPQAHDDTGETNGTTSPERSDDL